MERVSVIGFGEAGAALASRGWRGYDRKTDFARLRNAKLADFADVGVEACSSAADALERADAVLSLVTADQALAVAENGGRSLPSGVLWFDMNSVAPDTKRAAAHFVEAGGGRYVDVAVMAPVHPKRRAVPLLVSGQHAVVAAATLRTIGFLDVTTIDGPVGAASSIKMIRSVMVKGLEALTAECFLAAEAAGVRDAVAASLDASWRDECWAAKADYNLERMMEHGTRRAAEMEEVVRTLDALGTGSAMSRSTAERQRTIGGMRMIPPAGLVMKLRSLLPSRQTISKQDQAA
jgi:3-hydroxyisobutyrate dehydrogenase-like beta-hydroxyacid dehydrogenase